MPAPAGRHSFEDIVPMVLPPIEVARAVARDPDSPVRSRSRSLSIGRIEGVSGCFPRLLEGCNPLRDRLISVAVYPMIRKAGVDLAPPRALDNVAGGVDLFQTLFLRLESHRPAVVPVVMMSGCSRSRGMMLYSPFALAVGAVRGPAKVGPRAEPLAYNGMTRENGV